MTDHSPLADAPLAPGDTTDLRPASPEALQRAREVFGLDAVPTWAEQQRVKVNPQLKPEAKRRVRKLVTGLGTPLDFVRGLMRKTPPREWEDALRALSPKSETTSYLLFAWKEPPLAPERGRWCLYEAIPNALITVERRLELEGAPFWERPLAERQAHATIVSAYQWEMYRLYRVDVRPFWCIQGSEGGTPFHHSAIEKKYLTMMGKPAHPLPLGDLSFAPWDARVEKAVRERDRLVKLGGSVDRLRQSGGAEVMRMETEAAEREYRRIFWDWFGEKLGPQTELYAFVLKHEQPDRIRQTREDAIAASEARDRFIETGRVPDPIEYRRRKLVIAR